MKVTWTLDTDNPGDLTIISFMHKAIKFDSPTEEQLKAAIDGKASTKAKLKTVSEPETETKAPAAETKAPAAETKKKAPPKRKKRQPKEKTKDQLMALTLDDMIAYLKSRTKFSLLDCRVLAKHYNDEYGEVDTVLEILHKLEASTFDDLKKIPEFLVATIKMIEAKKAETEETEEETADDTAGFLGV